MPSDLFDGARFRQAASGATFARDDERLSLLSHRIRNEFEEMPGMCLSVPQACRLFDVSADVGAAILRELAVEGVLLVTRDGRYRLRSSAA